MFPTVYHPEFDNDVAEIYSWYECRRVGLGEQFLMVVEAAIFQSRRFPALCNPSELGVRRKYTNHFPYGIYYLFEDERVYFLTVLHVARDPELWKQRLK